MVLSFSDIGFLVSLATGSGHFTSSAYASENVKCSAFIVSLERQEEAACPGLVCAHTCAVLVPVILLRICEDQSCVLLSLASSNSLFVSPLQLTSA